MARQTTLSSPLPHVKLPIGINGACIGRTHLHKLLPHGLLHLNKFVTVFLFLRQSEALYIYTVACDQLTKDKLFRWLVNG